MGVGMRAFRLRSPVFLCSHIHRSHVVAFALPPRPNLQIRANCNCRSTSKSCKWRRGGKALDISSNQKHRVVFLKWTWGDGPIKGEEVG